MGDVGGNALVLYLGTWVSKVVSNLLELGMKGFIIQVLYCTSDLFSWDKEVLFFGFQVLSI